MRNFEFWPFLPFQSQLLAGFMPWRGFGQFWSAVGLSSLRPPEPESFIKLLVIGFYSTLYDKNWNFQFWAIFEIFLPLYDQFEPWWGVGRFWSAVGLCSLRPPEPELIIKLLLIGFYSTLYNKNLPSYEEFQILAIFAISELGFGRFMAILSHEGGLVNFGAQLISAPWGLPSQNLSSNYY